MSLLLTGNDPVERLASIKNNLDCACERLDKSMLDMGLTEGEELFVSGTAELLIALAFEYGRLYDRVFPNPATSNRPVSYFTQKSLDTLLPSE